MTEPTSTNQNDTNHTSTYQAKSLPHPTLVKQRWMPSLVWLIPIIAAIISLMLVVKFVLERGPEITISFDTAEGLTTGSTKVKYKNVDIGEVTDIKLSDDLGKVIATVQLTEGAENFTSTDTKFWVVTTRITAAGVSGLNTLLSGSYIGADAGLAKETKSDFEGLSVPPIVTNDSSGKQYVLHADNIGSLNIGSPIFYRRIQVGQVAAYELDKDGKGVTFRIFVNTPYDKLVGLNTRFWHASGVDIKVDASGLSVDTESLSSIILGGLAFQSIHDNPGPVAKENTNFLLAANQKTAFKVPDGVAETFVLYFDQSIRGLAPGAIVDFRGVALGEVKSVGIDFDREKRMFKMPVVVEIYPSRLGSDFVESTSDIKIKRLQTMINRGLRAQLRTGNLLTGQLYVALDFFPKMAKTEVDMAQNPIILPTVPGDLDALQSQIASIANKLNKVPFDEIGDGMQKSLVSLNQSLSSADILINKLNNDVAPEMSAALKDVRITLGNANTTLNNASNTLSDKAPLQQDLRQTLQDLSRAANSLKVLTDYLEQHPESLLKGKLPDNANK